MLSAPKLKISGPCFPVIFGRPVVFCVIFIVTSAIVSVVVFLIIIAELESGRLPDMVCNIEWLFFADFPR
ncbi:unnamed protein product [Soboliphyme baturini]|uniref:Uncharacterized protein n=1 Tax=Soboliphyme baturini TaxID=241478 RepID=A0A183IGL3_9BILA|nr:unnamed protein product [Soboliphyme baturini]